MYKKILVPIALDHAAETSVALDVAETLASEGASIVALHVIEEVPAYAANFLPEGHRDTVLNEVAKELRAALVSHGDIKPVVVNGHPGRAIVDYADENGIDCIVIASHRPGLQDYFIGSTANRVVRHASCTVHVLR